MKKTKKKMKKHVKKALFMKFPDVKEDVSLAPFTTFRIGGHAEYFLERGCEKDLIGTVRFLQRENIPVKILGEGSNVLISDQKVHGLVIRIRPRDEKVKFFWITSTNNSSVRCTVFSGTKLSSLVLESVKSGYRGLEYYLGIPGSVGGAIVMNVHGKDERKRARWHTLSEVVHSIKIIDRMGKISVVSKNTFYSCKGKSEFLKKGCMVLSATMKLKKGSKKELARYQQDYTHFRAIHQPKGKSAGCIFRNPLGESAGRLIDQSGCKGMRIGDAVVSTIHANFILNLDRACAGDVVKLISIIGAKVYEKFQIKLEREIKIIC